MYDSVKNIIANAEKIQKSDELKDILYSIVRIFIDNQNNKNSKSLSSMCKNIVYLSNKLVPKRFNRHDRNTILFYIEDTERNSFILEKQKNTFQRKLLELKHQSLSYLSNDSIDIPLFYIVVVVAIILIYFFGPMK
jgi:hypothetical protein